ncbi:hypothetical protein HWI77_05690 [Acinetobacter venetianus]|nr:hypothetical protein HWI77_05690 [Acinetobacter venetianus]
MTKDIELKAIDELIYEIEMFEQAGVYPNHDFIENLKTLAAKVKEETKLEGSVVAPVWISVDFLLPDLDSKVLIYIGNEVISAEYTILGFVDSIEGAMLHQDLITYWTQLPNGPEADTEGLDG